MPPLEPDSQTYHFYRAYMFWENHNLNHFDTNDNRALIMPINSEIIYTWILALKHKLYNYALLSYFSYFAIIAAIWQILSYLKYSIRKKIFAIFVFSSLASVVVEMSCLQTDIVVGALYICGFALFLKKKNYLSSLCVAIALGTKTTAFIVFIPYILILYVLNKKDLLKYLSYMVFNFIIFSSYNYILNFIQYGNFFANHSAYEGHKFWGGIRGYITNLIHFCFQFLDFTGFSWGYYLNNKLFALKDMIFNLIHLDPSIGNNVSQKQINIVTDEQIIGFGILGFLALIPSVFKGLFSKKKMLFILSLAFILNILILARAMAYMEYSIRFVLTFACFSAPIFVLIYQKRGLYKFLIGFFCIFYMAVIPTHILRAPFFKIMPRLIQNNFNIEKVIVDCFEGNVTSIWHMTPFIKNIILERYPNAKKIGYFKTTASSALYLKYIFDIDFLTASKMDEYDLNKYDLIIFEGYMQDDDVFKEAQIKYTYDGETVKFKNKKLDCYYLNNSDEVVSNKETAIRRFCFSTYHFKKNKNFKLDYNEEFKDEFTKQKIYFFTKLN